MNCVANGKLARSGLFSEIWVQPAAGDAGCALGVALEQDIKHSKVRLYRQDNQMDAMQGAYLGPDFSDDEIISFLKGRSAPFLQLTEKSLFAQVADLLANGHVVGWFQGRMEFGPRALGARSIIGDPRNAEMQKTMNLKIKFRESFRPFAPVVLAENSQDYFDMTQHSLYMLIVSSVLEKWLSKTEVRGLGSINEVRSELPAITHVDNSARVQTVHDETNSRFAGLLRVFQEKTGCPVLVNTSFNVRGEPIVRSPEEAYTCFMRTNMDVLVLNTFVLHKKEQPPLENDVDWRKEIALD